MDTRKHIYDELKEINSLLPLDKGTEVYAVPEGYFEGFAASVLQKIKNRQIDNVSDELTSLSPLLAGISKKMPFAVPENYFSENTESLPGLITEDSLPDMLQNDKQMPYTVPTNYFKNLPDVILKRVNPKEAKVISINSARKWMRYAAAAIITGVIVISSVLYFGKNQSIDPASQPQEWVAKQLKNIPDKELDEFINTTTVNSTAIARAEVSEKTEVRNLLKDIPDMELDKFLDEVAIDYEDIPAIN
jgi:hypothetical protein